MSHTHSESAVLPTLPLRDMVVYPHMVLPLFLSLIHI